MCPPATMLCQSAADTKAATPFSVVDLYTIGVGPSSSHTVGPMRAAFRFAARVEREPSGVVKNVSCELFGSLALTGIGHGTDTAIMLGLAGWEPELVDPDQIPSILGEIDASHALLLGGKHRVAFERSRDLIFHRNKALPFHPNGMRFTAVFDDGEKLCCEYFSIGGGALVEGGENGTRPSTANVPPHPFASAGELLALGESFALSFADIVRENEAAWRPGAETEVFLDAVQEAMFACIERGCARDGILPGGLNVRRRARKLFADLDKHPVRHDPGLVFQWVSLWALAVNEENAAGGRVVTAPTNGAAGIIPAVLKYYEAFTPAPTRKGSQDLLLTAAAIGMLYKKRASISAAEMGCQGEVGVACSMAAAGLAAALGGSNRQVENAAEIGMEHNLGLTCDPVGGLVQIPCIERNTMGAVKAINAAHLALQGDGEHIVSLDSVIETMRQTGEDMRSQYKETSLGGLAVNVVEC